MYSENIDLLNEDHKNAAPAEIVQWVRHKNTHECLLTTSFGIYSAALIHLVINKIPKIPVLWIDTGYLPKETYRFAEDLINSFNLNIHIYQSPMSAARMEALYGKLYESEKVEEINNYDFIRKVEPMHRALRDLGTKYWLAGLRQKQTENRNKMNYFNMQNGIMKILPIFKWSTKDIYYYIKNNGLPMHPLFDKGYATIGDWHSSRPMEVTDTDERSIRFKGLKQECGLHLELTQEQKESLNSSGL